MKNTPRQNLLSAARAQKKLADAACNLLTDGLGPEPTVRTPSLRQEYAAKFRSVRYELRAAHEQCSSIDHIINLLEAYEE